MPAKLSAADWHDLVARNPGLTVARLAELTGKPLGTVRSAVSLYGLAVAKERADKPSWEHCHAEGMSAIEAAKARGVTPGAAFMWARSAGYKWPDTRALPWRQRPAAASSDMPRPSRRGVGPGIDFLIFGAKPPSRRARKHDGSFATWGELAILENEAALEAYR